MPGQGIPESCWISPTVEARPSPGRGKGLFAREAVAAGELVVVWGGRSYTDGEGARRARADGRFVMQWDDDLFSYDAEVSDAFAINHSCDPNVWLEGAFRLTAMRDIPPGEELSMDYATIPGEAGWRSEWECACGSPECRGRVTGEDWKLTSLRRRYRGHFAPLLEKRIAKLYPEEGGSGDEGVRVR